MSRRLIAVLLLTVTVLLVGAGSLYAYDREVRTRIADGVTVNGIDVGGLTPAQARAKLEASLLDPLSRPVSVRYKGRRFTLTQEQAQVAVDLDGSVDRAMAASTKGNLFTRTWREVRGTELDARVEAKINYSEAAVRKIVDRVERRLEIEPRDASLDLESGQVEPIESRDGLDVRAARLRKDDPRRAARHGRHSDRPRQDPRARAEGDHRRAGREVSGDHHRQPRRLPALVLQEPQAAQDLRHRGRPGGAGDAGGPLQHREQGRQPGLVRAQLRLGGLSLAGTVVPGGTPQNPLKARWMGIYAGAGIHGTDATGSIGTAASHGCIRMLIPDVIELYDQVPVGAPVYIA